MLPPFWGGSELNFELGRDFDPVPPNLQDYKTA